MIRAVLLYVAVVALPAGLLATFAFRAAEQDYRDGLEAQRSRLEEEAAALARRVEAAFADAGRRGDAALAAAQSAREGKGELPADLAVGFAREGRWIGYTTASGLDTEPPPSAEEMRFFELSLRGGESWELRFRDPARALDAYSFYLPRIRSKALRARLTFRAARAALAAGNERLCRALLESLLGEGSREASEDGMPLAVLAALRLRDLGDSHPAHDAAAGEPCSRFKAGAAGLPTPLLALLARECRPPDPELLRAVERRRALELAAGRRPEMLAAGAAAAGDGWLLVARELPAIGGQREVRALACEPVELPPLEAGNLEARFDRDGPPTASAAAADAVSLPSVSRKVRLSDNGPELGAVSVRDPEFDSRRGTLETRRDLQRALVGLLAFATLAGGTALFYYLVRERSLARLRAQLIANVSHELKTPATSIRMFSEMIVDEQFDAARTRRFALLLRAESLRLSRLLESLLDLSRLKQLDEDLAFEPVNVEALLRQIADGFAPRADSEGVELRTAIGVLPPVHSNAQAIERILLNLLDNALKYRGRESPWIRIEGKAAGGRVLIAVADNGIGIPARERERVFQELYRVRYDDYSVPGTGLGLALAQRLARKLGGDIELESREGEGSTFTLWLPDSAPARGAPAGERVAEG